MKRERLSDELCACMRACACVIDECAGVHGKGGSILQKKMPVKLQGVKKRLHLMDDLFNRKVHAAAGTEIVSEP